MIREEKQTEKEIKKQQNIKLENWEDSPSLLENSRMEKGLWL